MFNPPFKTPTMFQVETPHFSIHGFPIFSRTLGIFPLRRSPWFAQVGNLRPWRWTSTRDPDGRGISRCYLRCYLRWFVTWWFNCMVIYTRFHRFRRFRGLPFLIKFSCQLSYPVNVSPEPWFVHPPCHHPWGGLTSLISHWISTPFMHVFICCLIT